MALTPEQLKARLGKLTASRVGALVSGDDQKVINLWREMVGDPTFVQEDLSGIWPIRLGSATEEANLNWYEFKTGSTVSRRGEVVIMPEHDWAAATLDGWDDTLSICIECKHVGGREPRERIIERYTPQCTWQMLVTGTETIALSIIEGANAPVVEWLKLDASYAGELWCRACDFMVAVDTMSQPVAEPALKAIVAATKTYDMTGNNLWASEASVWLETRVTANDNERAEKNLKTMVPADAQTASGYGVEITRDRANRLKLRAAA